MLISSICITIQASSNINNLQASGADKVTAEKQQQLLYLSDMRVFFVGQAKDTLTFSSTATNIVISLGKQIELTRGKELEKVRAKSFLIPADSPASIDAGSETIVIIVLDFLGDNLRKLKLNMCQVDMTSRGGGCYWDLRDEEKFISIVSTLRYSELSADIVFEHVDNWVGGFVVKGSGTSRDFRITKAINYIRANSARQTSVEELASHVCLSVPRLTQLFRQEVGVPIRRMRLWHRIQAVAIYFSEGIGLGEATLLAGFSDYAHFSRSYKEVAGLTPSKMFSDGVKVVVLAGDRSLKAASSHRSLSLDVSNVREKSTLVS